MLDILSIQKLLHICYATAIKETNISFMLTNSPIEKREIVNPN